MKFSYSEKEVRSGYFPTTGEGLARVYKVEHGNTKNGDQQLIVSLRGVGDWNGLTGKSYFTLKQSVEFLLIRFWKALGFTEQELVAGIDDQDAVGRLVRIKSTLETGKDGKDYPRYNYIKPSDQDVIENPLDEPLPF